MPVVCQPLTLADDVQEALQDCRNRRRPSVQDLAVREVTDWTSDPGSFAQWQESRDGGRSMKAVVLE